MQLESSGVVNPVTIDQLVLQYSCIEVYFLLSLPVFVQWKIMIVLKNWAGLATIVNAIGYEYDCKSGRRADHLVLPYSFIEVEPTYT